MIDLRIIAEITNTYDSCTISVADYSSDFSLCDCADINNCIDNYHVNVLIFVDNDC